MSQPSLPDALRRVVDEVLEASGLGFAEGREEVEEELVAHFEDGLARGVSEAELIRRFGDPVQAGLRIARTRPRAQAMGRGETGGWWMSMEVWWNEILRAGRRLRRAPGFTAIVVLTLALGVGVNTAIFTVLHAVLLDDLPYEDPERLVRIYERHENWGDMEYLRAPLVVELREWDEVFDGVASMYTYREQGADLTDGDIPVRVNAMAVSAGYFETLGRTPLMGRTFEDGESFGTGDAEDTPPPPVAMLSHSLWQGHFGGTSGIIGRTVQLDGQSIEVVGVMPADFRNPFGVQADLWVPQNLRPGGSNHWRNFYLSGIARVREGVDLDLVDERLAVLGAALVERVPEADHGTTAVRPLQSDVVGETRQTMLWILAAAAALVLLTACVNVANLLFARGLGRDRSLALQSALGSGRGRLIASILLENAILASLGGVLGLVFGWVGVELLLAISPDALPGVANVTFGFPVFAFALLVTAGALVVFGLTPALRMSRTAPAEVLRSGDRASTVGRLVRRLRDGLVITQVAAALVLVVGAALLTRSFGSLLDVPLGIEPEGAVTFEVHLPGTRYPTPEDRVRFHDEYQERLRSIAGVQSVGATSWLPVNGRYHSWGFNWVPNDEPDPDGEFRSTDVRMIHGDYFEAMGIQLVQGDPPSALDLEAEPVVWINEEIVRTTMPDVDPLTQRIGLAGAVRRVAGVVADVPFSTRGEISPKSYVPHRQGDSRNWALTQVVRADGDLDGLLDAARTELRAMDPALVLYRPESVDGLLDRVRAQDRFATTLMAAFGLLALTLSLVGTYGVLSGSVASRTREIGIRIALGADTGSVRSLVLRYAAALTIPGVVVGLGLAWVASGWIEALLFEVGAGDPWAYVAGLAAFAGVGALAGWLPARRATRVDTVEVLTAE